MEFGDPLHRLFTDVCGILSKQASKELVGSFNSFVFPFQALQNQKRKTEEARSETSSVQRELLSLSETCQALEQQRAKLQSELTAKENQNAFLTGQLKHSKSTLEKELAQVSKPCCRCSSSVNVHHCHCDHC